MEKEMAPQKIIRIVWEALEKDSLNEVCAQYGIQEPQLEEWKDIILDLTDNKESCLFSQDKSKEFSKLEKELQDIIESQVKDKTLKDKLESLIGVYNKRLAKVQNKYDKLFNNINDLLFFSKFDSEERGNFIEVNEKAVELLGYSKDELLNMGPQDIVTSFKRNKKLDSVGKDTFEKKFVTKDGQKIPVEINSNIFELEGEKYILSIARDITERKKSEKKIKEKRNQLEILNQEYETIFNNTQDAMFIIKVEDENTYRYLRTNKAFQLLTGLSLTEVRGETPCEIFTEEVAREVIDNYRRCYKSKTSIEYQETLELPVGKRNWHTILSPVVKEGEVIQIVGSARDITEQKRAREELKKSEAKFKKYINNAPYGVFVCDENGEYIEVNKTACEMTGYTEEELIGMNFRQLIPPESYSQAEQSFTELLDKGRSYVELGLLRKDGRAKYWSVNAVKLAENRFLGFTRDITQRKQVEEVLGEQQAYFQQLFNKSPEGIALLDNEERIAMINKSFEEIFEYKSAEIEGRKINKVLVPESKLAEVKHILAKVKQGESYTGESVRKTKSDNQINVAIKAFPIKLGDDQLGIYVIYKDITERKAEESRIKYLSFHDQLTGLYNRRYFENEMKRLNKSRKLPIAIIVVDMDGLKEINDNYGHQEGDRHIKIIADIIDSSTREADIVARIGGDEFVILLPEADDEIANSIKDRIIDKCKSFTRNFNRKLSVSIGFAIKNERDEDLNETFKKADAEMYKLKRQKKRKEFFKNNC
ncbi:sensor domain-containing diguanylate cyclase [Fuchsiella alkaliacetigena]|uniref:sensor domain-containing diguanylate cyclase n=1 Tax=Fuchsiella alkaliacetigena TaxID=957042 RepID=UPI00200B26B9|nr:PAS domain S-box protein [Fuchsiella alkaliacetigena]MCK8825615.1 PAS domain S-box protein [Fuchsiella alkaliacetigena]